MSSSKDVSDACGKIVAGFNAAFDEEKAHLQRRFTEKNGDGKNVLLLDNASEWTVARDTAMYTVGNVRVAGCVITGDAVDRFAELERSAPRWISVKDELPENGTICLVCGAKGGTRVARLRKLEKCAEWTVIGTGKQFNASHWMELPSPPKN